MAMGRIGGSDEPLSRPAVQSHLLHESSNVGSGYGNPYHIELYSDLLATIDLPAFVKYGFNLPFEYLVSAFWPGRIRPPAPVIVGIPAHIEHLTYLLDWK